MSELNFWNKPQIYGHAVLFLVGYYISRSFAFTFISEDSL